MKVPVVINGWVEMPDDPEDMLAAYNTADPVDAVRFDMDNNPAWFYMDVLQIEAVIVAGVEIPQEG